MYIFRFVSYAENGLKPSRWDREGSHKTIWAIKHIMSVVNFEKIYQVIARSEQQKKISKTCVCPIVHRENFDK